MRRRPRPAAGAGLRGAAIAFTLRWATQIDLPGRSYLLRAGQRVLSPLEQPAGITTTAGCLRAGDRVEVVDHAPQPLDPGPLMEHRVHPGRRRTLLGQLLPRCRRGTAQPGPVRSIAIGVFGVPAADSLEGLLDVRGPPRTGANPGGRLLIGTATRGHGGVFGSVDPVGIGQGTCLGDPAGLVADRVPRGPDSAFAAFAAILVPSIDTTPTLTIPSAAHSRSTCADQVREPLVVLGAEPRDRR